LRMSQTSTTAIPYGVIAACFRNHTIVPFLGSAASFAGASDPGVVPGGAAFARLLAGAATYARSTAEARAARPCASAGRAPDDGAMMATDTARDTRDSQRARLVFTPVLLSEPGHWSAPGDDTLNTPACTAPQSARRFPPRCPRWA
jgi:hypothetical protein